MTSLCQIEDSEKGQSKSFEVCEKTVFAVKKDNIIYVYQNRCPHVGVELEWLEDQFLDPDGALIQCSNHGALFLIEDGSCVAGPCMGEQLIPIGIDINDGEVFIKPSQAD